MKQQMVVLGTPSSNITRYTEISSSRPTRQIRKPAQTISNYDTDGVCAVFFLPRLLLPKKRKQWDISSVMICFNCRFQCYSTCCRRKAARHLTYSAMSALNNILRNSQRHPVLYLWCIQLIM